MIADNYENMLAWARSHSPAPLGKIPAGYSYFPGIDSGILVRVSDIGDRKIVPDVLANLARRELRYDMSKFGRLVKGVWSKTAYAYFWQELFRMFPNTMRGWLAKFDSRPQMPVPNLPPQPKTVGGPVLDWLTGNIEEIERGRELDAKLKALNDALYEKQKISAAQRDQMNARIDSGGWETYSREVEQGFYAGPGEYYGPMVQAVKDAATSGVDFGKDAIKKALEIPATSLNAFKDAFAAALKAAGKAGQFLVVMQWIFAAGAIYLGYRLLKSDTGRKVARAYVAKRL